jgi:hypothetical protein
LEVQFDAPKQKVLGEEATHQRQQLDEQMKLKAAANIESSAEAPYLPRAVREWRGVGLREWPRSLTDDERELTEGVVEGIDYCEEKGWVAHYYAAALEEAPVTLADCEWSSPREVVQWALEIELPVEAAPVAPAVAAAGPLAGGEMAAGELIKLKAAELKAKLKKRDLPVGGRKADLVERLEKALAEDDEEAGLEEEGGYWRSNGHIGA